MATCACLATSSSAGTRGRLSAYLSVRSRKAIARKHLQAGRALGGRVLQRGGVLQALAQRLRVALERRRLQLRPMPYPR